jgi:hypothetical protein
MADGVVLREALNVGQGIATLASRRLTEECSSRYTAPRSDDDDDDR